MPFFIISLILLLFSVSSVMMTPLSQFFSRLYQDPVRVTPWDQQVPPPSLFSHCSIFCLFVFIFCGGDLSPHPGTGPWPSTVKAPSPNHWTTREVRELKKPSCLSWDQLIFQIIVPFCFWSTRCFSDSLIYADWCPRPCNTLNPLSSQWPVLFKREAPSNLCNS